MKRTAINKADNTVQPLKHAGNIYNCFDDYGYTWVKKESTQSCEPSDLANQSSEPIKFLSFESRSVFVTKERFGALTALVNC